MKQTVFAALAGLAVFCLFSCGVQDPAKPVFQKIAEESVESTGCLLYTSYSSEPPFRLPF